MRKNASGFTLIELLIVLAILAILATVAYNVYGNYTQQARRSAAQADLTELANFMERYYSNHGRYAQANGDAPELPFSHSPRETTDGDAYYEITVDIVDDGQGYELIAEPVHAQKTNSCGILTLTHTGKTKPTGNDCW